MTVAAMNILIVNPNISESVSDLIYAEAKRTASPDTHLTMATASFGVAYIETRFEALVGGYATAAPIRERAFIQAIEAALAEAVA